MRISDLPARSKSVLDLVVVDDIPELPAFKAGDFTKLTYSQVADTMWLQGSAGQVGVDGTDTRSRLQLRALLDRGLPRLTSISKIGNQGGGRPPISLQVNEYATEFVLPNALDLGIDDKIVDAVRKVLGTRLSVGAVVEYLQSQMVIDTRTGESAAVVIPSPDSRELGAAFRLIGHRHACDISQEDGYFKAVRFVANSKHQRAGSALSLVRGEISFTDTTMAAQYRAEASHLLDSVLQGRRGYLDFWKQYDELERIAIAEHAAGLGYLSYTNWRREPDGSVRFDLRRFDGLADTLHALEDEQGLSLEAGDAVKHPTLEDRDFERRYNGRVTSTSHLDSFITLQSDGDEYLEPPLEGYLYPRIVGDAVRLDRRRAARVAIQSGQNPMPHLALVLEGGAIRSSVRRRTPFGMSPTTLELFENGPTARQAEAMEVALNTPDIALIQGPPGTGKTLVIAAIQVRLAELAEKGIAGTTLLSSYQHDAVENAASRTSVFGLPALKLGNRPGEAGQDIFGAWMREHTHAIEASRAAFADMPISAAVRSLHLHYREYLLNSTDPVEALDHLEDLGRDFLSSSTLDQIDQLRSKISLGRRKLGGDDTDILSKAVRGLRVDAVSFGDDGPRRAFKLLRRLRESELLDEISRSLLERAAHWESSEAPPFLSDLEVLQARLLDNIQPDELPRDARMAHVDVAGIAIQAVDELIRKAKSEPGNAATVLDIHLNDIRMDPDSTKLAVAKYTSVLAATCQQAVGRHMSEFRQADSNFENVIVDEAARANPLDLLIPLSLAERRIILVGDHRQLPHMLEPEVERKLDGNIEVGFENALRQSLFERLFELAKRLEDVDGRRRTVTLDRQFRMHPVLGEFVSRTFYERHNPAERFESPLAASGFAHEIPEFEEAVAVWIDVPFTAGPELSGKSKRRPIEASRVAHEAMRLLRLRPDLSVGVISFYSAQVAEIWEQLIDLEIAERVGSGYRTLPAWANTVEIDGSLARERLRVGTVDAFQGKEFDVVILSITRSNRLDGHNPPTQRSKWGHLMLENRLCVAMSRQHRLLIAVGDAEMAEGEQATAAVPGLVALRQLCDSEHGLVIS